MPSSQSSGLMTIVIYVAVIGLFVFRMVRPQKISVARLFITPVILIAVTALSVWGNAMAASLQTAAVPAPPFEIAEVMLLGALAGIPLGILRGKHSEVKPTERRNVMYVHSSPLIVVVWLAAFALRALLRYLMPHSAPLAAVIGDGLLAFAVAALITSYLMIYQRYKGMTA